jgi:hypothetical protein
MNAFIVFSIRNLLRSQQLLVLQVVRDGYLVLSFERQNQSARPKRRNVMYIVQRHLKSRLLALEPKAEILTRLGLELIPDLSEYSSEFG